MSTDETVTNAPRESIIVPAAPPPVEQPMSTDETLAVTQRVESHRQDGEISIEVADVNAPPRVEMQREDGQVSTDVVDASPRLEVRRAYTRKMSISYLRHLCHRLAVETLRIWDELCDPMTYLHCLDTCFFFFFCHAFTSLLLSVTVCCRCCTSMLKMPDRIEKRTARTHKVVAFLAKHLSALWVSSLLVLFAWWCLFRPMDVKPHLAASIVSEFALESPHRLLRFNVTARVLFHNAHSHYKIRYRYFAATVVYAGTKLGPVDDDELPSFTQKPHESTVKLLPFVGRMRNASGMVEETFQRERVAGLLHMVVRIRVLLNYGFWPFKGDYFTIFDCPLRSPFPQMHDDDPPISSPALCNAVDLSF